MLRGHRTYLSLFQSEQPITDTIALPERRGRNEELIKQRNELLLHRHYFYTKIKKYPYHLLLSSLESEFFLTQRTVMDIVQSNTTLLRRINTDKIESRELRRKYPAMNWD
jgi:hypothetical protein